MSSTEVSAISIPLTFSVNGTVAANTRFHNSYGTYSPIEPPTLNNLSIPGQNVPTKINTYTASPELLNQALLNITLSIIADYKLWNTARTEVTQWKIINVYSFSKPLNLIIPYFVTLLVTIPILAIGMLTLLQNGVSAVDGGFIQLITTSTGSEALEKLAGGACLGGDESVPKELKDLKIRFGELVGVEKGWAMRRAGFGTEEETVPLTKGALYGRSYQNWI